MQLLIKTFHGLEAVLAEEVKDLGGKNIELLRRAVSCEGDLKFLYMANHHLRTALKVLLPIEHFNARNEVELYNKTKQINWSKYLQLNQTFAIDPVVFSKTFTHSQYVGLKVKDAIVDQFRDKTGRRPDVDTQFPEVSINVHVSNNQVNISLDSSGESLHKRGYRRTGHPAPLNECLAAGMLLLAGWEPSIPLIDPMCGTGTILIEAAMMAAKIPPGVNRRKYLFMNWKDFDRDLWMSVVRSAKQSVEAPTVSIIGGDIDSQSIDLAKMGSLDFGLGRLIKLERIAFKSHLPKTKEGLLIFNPPYGERLREKDLNAMYQEIGDHLKANYNGFDAWILSSNTEAMKHIGLRPSQKLTLYNGPLECKFQQFNVYEGSLKKKEKGN
ncbi:MAG: class I SAM-dependent RNA methyltransferase [Flavobacteriales bacterium]|nr:class I SAM-dependent RNA methyltransferase [Flavobacteriales bacterium]